MPDLDLDALATSITVRKAGVTYTLVPNMTANEAEAWFDEKTTDRLDRSKRIIAQAALPHHKTMTPEKVGDIFMLDEIFSIVQAFLVRPGPAQASRPGVLTPLERKTRKTSPQKTPARS